MRPVDIEIDAARLLQIRGVGRVRAVFARALYLQVPGGLVVLVTAQAPRGPLHLRVAALPPVAAGCPVRVDAVALRVGDHAYPFDVPVWSPRLSPTPSLAPARQSARRWLPAYGPALEVGSTGQAELPEIAAAALHRGDLPLVAATIGGRGPGLTPAGDDMLAGVLLVARALGSGSSPARRALRQCAFDVRTNDIARAFLACAARGRCIEPAHELLAGLASADQAAVGSALQELHHFGSSSGAALAYGVRAALLELPTTPWIGTRGHDQRQDAYSGK